MYAVYMYIKDDMPVYVGKTNISIENRVWAHENEEAFQPYKDAKIYYAELNNASETTVFETVLINNLKPILNCAMIYDNSRYLDFDESILEWKEYTGRRTRKIPEDERVLALAIKQYRLTLEQREAERAKYFHKPRKVFKPRKDHVYGSGSFSEQTKGRHKYIRFVKRIDGKRKEFYGKTKDEAYSKYIKYIEKIRTNDGQ